MVFLLDLFLIAAGSSGAVPFGEYLLHVPVPVLNSLPSQGLWLSLSSYGLVSLPHCQPSDRILAQNMG